MFFHKHAALLILFSVTSNISISMGQPVDQCLSSVDVQSMRTDYSRAFEDLLQATSISQSDNLNTLFPIRDYTTPQQSRRATNPYNLFRDACSALGNDYSVCAVTTTVQYSSSTTVVKEVVKPVCFPVSCNDEEVDLLDATPLGCLPENGCRILEREVNCPIRGFFPNGRPGNCAADAMAINANEDMQDNLSSLEKRMNGECRTNLFGGSSDWCSFHAIDASNVANEVQKIFNSENVPALTTYNVVKDFSPLTGSTLRSYISECESMGHTVCRVDTETVVNDIRMFEVAKPICIPDVCTVDDVATLDPFPLCETEDCEISSKTVNCPAISTVGTSQGNCEQATRRVLQDNQLNDFLESLSDNVNRDCAQVIMGMDSEECKVVLPTAANITVSGVEEASNAIAAFETTCSMLGNQICKVSATTSTDLRDDTGFIDVTTEYVNVPTCVPIECTDDAMKISAVNKSVFICDEGVNCAISGVEINCIAPEPSKSPSLPPSFAPSVTASLEPSSLPTKTPTASPTVTPTLSTEPTITESSAPSLTLSSPPSLVASSNPSAELSSSPSGSPTLLRSSSPTVQITAAPEGPEPEPELTFRERIFTRQNSISAGVMLGLFCICFITICVETYRMS